MHCNGRLTRSRVIVKIGHAAALVWKQRGDFFVIFGTSSVRADCECVAVGVPTPHGQTTRRGQTVERSDETRALGMVRTRPQLTLAFARCSTDYKVEKNGMTPNVDVEMSVVISRLSRRISPTQHKPRPSLQPSRDHQHHGVSCLRPLGPSRRSAE